MAVDEKASSSRRLFVNQLAAAQRLCAERDADHGAEGRFHRDVLPGYKPSALQRLHVAGFEGHVYAKDESDRFGLPAFKVLGSSYATYVQLCRRWGLDLQHATLRQLKARAQAGRHHHDDDDKARPVLVCATDGNHGRGLAWVARLLGLPAHIFVPHSVQSSSVQRIRDEGAIVRQLDLDYDATVIFAAQHAAEVDGGLLIQDTSFEGYQEIPRQIVQGYATIFTELAAAMQGNDDDDDDDDDDHHRPATHIICPVGVGSLAQACVLYSPTSTKVIAVEPTAAPCLFTSLQNDCVTRVITGHTVMPGLNCGLVSLDAWPVLRSGIAAAVLVDDDEAMRAVDVVQQQGVAAGPCGGAPLAGLQVLLRDPQACSTLGLDHTSHVVLLITEGNNAG